MDKDVHNDDYWIPFADLMTGMMLIFLLLSIALIVKIRHVSDSYVNVKLKIYNDLYKEFKNDLPTWNASLSKDDLTIKFNEPSILFTTGKANLKPRFENILSDFFPRYIRKLQSDGSYKSNIREIRIDGYTSSVWGASTSIDENMDLSQQRTRQVLEYVYNLEGASISYNIAYRRFIRDYVTANGLSSSHLIYNKDGTENIEASQRVEFKIDLNADQKLKQIYKADF
jgi:outer membrane protein OmpA-like peptidoglycan-associated protein